MGAPQYEQAGADIGGTGTPNTIPRWTGPSTLGDSGLIDNGTAIYTTTRNFGIGTASPQNLLQLGLAAVFAQDTNTLYTGSNFTGASAGNFIGSAWAVQQYFDRAAGVIGFRRSSASGTAGNAISWLESARIDSAGRLLVGTTGTPSSGAVRVVVAANSGGQQWHSQGLGGCAVVASANTAQWYVYPGANVGSEGYLSSVKLTETGLDVTTASATPGIKLPATPGNADTQTLDCYQENYASNSWTPVIFGGTTAGTATYSVQEGFYTRWGNLIFCTATVVFSGHTGTGNLSLSGLPFAAKTAGSGTYRSSIIIEEGGGVKAILRLQSGTTATTTGVSIAASGNYVISFVYATN